MLMRAHQEQTSLSFPILIIQLCEAVGVPYQERSNVRVTPYSSNDIRRIGADHLRDDAARKKLTPPDTTLMVDPTILEADDTHPAPLVEPPGTPQPSSIPSSSTTPSTSYAPIPTSRSPLT
uniref:Integrase core domain containing protein n=1 Tax=Solanum tuberosum TaxID=4113 RepID=M1DUH8_SOLTU